MSCLLYGYKDNRMPYSSSCHGMIALRPYLYV